MKTSELTGNALNWAVNYAEGLRGIFAPVNYSGKWEHGGPIIERERIGVLHVEDRLPHQQWDAGETDELPDTLWAVVSGPTPLIAAMRCYVASKLGEEVNVPEGLS